MAIGVVKHRRAPTSDRLLVTPEEGELFVDTDTWLVYIGDGVTAGGILIGSSVSGGSIVTKTADYSLLTSDSGNQYNNTGASADIALNLPAGTVGLTYAGAVTAAHYVKFLADGTDIIYWGEDPTAAGGYIRHNGVGSFVNLICHATGKWVVSSITGSWKIDV